MQPRRLPKPTVITQEVDVYEGPNGSLCVWGEDIGMVNYEQNITHGDEMLGHVMASLLDGEWKFLHPLDVT